MSLNDEVIIDNLLCFINSAKDDYPKETLKDVAFAFYSHEQIKNSKTTLYNLLKKDITWRRDPDKKRKDLGDIIESHEELTTGRNRWKFLCNSYKGMPPLGMEMIAPLLINLTTEVTKINEYLPKVLDMKSEVLNTADTVRQMRIDLTDMRGKFTSAVSGMEEATKDIATEEVSIINDLRTFRMSIGASGFPDFSEGHLDKGQPDDGVSSVPDDVATAGASADVFGEIPNLERDFPRLVTDRDTEAVSGGNNSLLTAMDASFSQALQKKTKSQEKIQANLGSKLTSLSTHEKSRLNTAVRKSGSTGFRGAKKHENSAFRAVKRTADVFLGRVSTDATENDILDYVKNNFSVTVTKVEKLQIKTDLYNAFKITVFLVDREKLFNSELWPEDVIVNKFFNRSKRNNSVNK